MLKYNGFSSLWLQFQLVMQAQVHVFAYQVRSNENYGILALVDVEDYFHDQLWGL
ncbi:hypothetical protein Sjap_010827 [Stephania japonica]|uniref:Uncharacterized protein n=1 Tax=Stephania japonica TaxID=461633 RepID=A0AAP0JB64_9MAGN